VAGECEEVVLSAEEGAMWLIKLTTCSQEDDVHRYVRSRIESWRDSYFLASAKVS
jgi:hypothetical protein